jgi:hypothetical protein
MNAIMARGDLAGSAGGGIDSKISSWALTSGYDLLHPIFIFIHHSRFLDSCVRFLVFVSKRLCEILGLRMVGTNRNRGKRTAMAMNGAETAPSILNCRRYFVVNASRLINTTPICQDRLGTDWQKTNRAETNGRLSRAHSQAQHTRSCRRSIGYGEKHLFLRCHFAMLKIIILPRQARDKHSENAKLKKERCVWL